MERLNEKIRYGIVLFVITACVGLLLSVANFWTKNVIADREVVQQEKAREAVLGRLEYDDKEINEPLWTYMLEEKVVGYTIIASGNGYGGEIKIMVGMDSDLKVLGVDILSHNETPGLGSKAGAEVAPQFVGKEAPFSLEKIDGISGATITSKAVVDIVNGAVKQLEMRNEE